MDGFEAAEIDAGEARIFARWSGAGPPVLLLHGFPETHLMWRDVAPLLARSFTVVCADLRGYGRSSCPPSSADHEPYSKRAMARDMAALMAALGFGRFHVAGHDRGARVAYRLALDSPDRVERLAVLDIVTTADAWERADARLALGYWPWSILAQAAPLPERLLSAAPEAVLDAALGGWGTPSSVFPVAVREAYLQPLRDPAHVHAICEEYRAAGTLDWQHDRADRHAGRRLAGPVLALWSSAGPLGSWYANAGGPLALWRPWCTTLQGRPVDGGHFFPEERPSETAHQLERFFAG
jgi:haloacetate dehalogenase